MLISGGNDSKLFTYPANAFHTFHAHEICAAPQRPHVQLASGGGKAGANLFMAQYSTRVDVWRTHTNFNTILDLKEGLDFRKDVLGKRKVGNGGGLTANRAADFPARNGNCENSGSNPKPSEMAKARGISPELVARIKAKSAEHICCSAISGNGQFLAFSDRLKPRLYELEREKLGSQSSKKKGITKRKLPENIPAALSMQFTHDNTRLLLGRPHEILVWVRRVVIFCCQSIHCSMSPLVTLLYAQFFAWLPCLQVIDVEDALVVHSFHVDAPRSPGEENNRGLSPLKLMCASADSQWLAAITSSGYVHVFNLETLK